MDAICALAANVHGDVRVVVAAQVDRLAPLAAGPERDILIERSVARLDGLGVLEQFLQDPQVDEVMVNRGCEVWIDRAGTSQQVALLETGAVDVILERILAPLGKRLDRTSPIVDARLPGGARLCAVVQPIAIDGTALSIRRHRVLRFRIDDFATSQIRDLLTEIVRRRCNVLITGATSTGKTSLLAALVSLCDRGERLVTVEDTAELALDSMHAVKLEARPATADGVVQIDQVELVRTALRLRPDRLIIGEFRGSEVLAVIQALNTGHDGSLSTCHANSAVDGLRRVETLVMQAAPTWPLSAIRRQVSRSIDVVVHLERSRSGVRHIVEVAEVVESGDEPCVRDLVVDGSVVATLNRSRT